jgi:iron complex transport system ATP-binding protein
MSLPATILDVSGLEVRLAKRAVLHDVALSVQEGELVAVVGPNGAGKTTLLRAVAGLVPVQGRIEIIGTSVSDLPIAERARRVAYLPQGHVFHWPLPASEIVALGRLPLGAGADLSEADRLAVGRAMAATGVTEFAERMVTTLSGGERARAGTHGRAARSSPSCTISASRRATPIGSSCSMRVASPRPVSRARF